MASNGYVDITRGSLRGGHRGWKRQVEPCDYIASVNGESDMEVATVHGGTGSRGRGPGTERGDLGSVDIYGPQRTPPESAQLGNCLVIYGSWCKNKLGASQWNGC